MLLAPFRARSAHVVQLGPVGIKHPAPEGMPTREREDDRPYDDCEDGHDEDEHLSLSMGKAGAR
jgi:hypothetical protein